MSDTGMCATGRLLVWFYGEQSCMWVAPEHMEPLGSYQDLFFGLRLTALRHWGRKQLKCALCQLLSSRIPLLAEVSKAGSKPKCALLSQLITGQQRVEEHDVAACRPVSRARCEPCTCPCDAILAHASAAMNCQSHLQWCSTQWLPVMPVACQQLAQD